MISNIHRGQYLQRGRGLGGIFSVIVAHLLYHHATSHIILRAPLSVSGLRTKPYLALNYKQR